MSNKVKESEFIIGFLKKWNGAIPNIQITYGFEKSSGFHVVEISQNEIFSSKEFKALKNELYKAFFDEFKVGYLIVCQPNIFNELNKVYYKNF